MKKIILSGFIALSLLFTTASCDSDDDHDHVITVSDLPQTASAFVTAYFPDAAYQIIKKQNKADFDGSLYDVYLTNGFEIEFDANGNWIDIDGNYQAIPADLIPEKIKAYITENYPSQFVTSIDHEVSFTEIELSNNLELVFDLQGNFLKIDK
jgi:hypothetical protein